MEKNTSFTQNLFNGIKTRIKDIFSGRKNQLRINWFYEKYLKHLPPDRAHSDHLLKFKTEFRGGPDYLNAIHEIFQEKVYDQTLPDNAFIIDCGGHIGISVIYLKEICPSAEILCFEPDKINFDLLVKNIRSHNLTKVSPVNKAVWTTDTILYFEMDGNMSSRIIKSSDKANQVEACRLFDYIDRKVDFLKIDIEGAEYEVLKDIAPKLDMVQKMFVEYHGSFEQNKELIELLTIFTEHHFRFYIKEAGPVYPQPFTEKRGNSIYDLQLNIFCMKNN